MPTPTSPAATRQLKIALIGNPNVGKSTLFNALAGFHSRVGNFPGVTVEKKIGDVTWDDTHFALIDLPGTYSLSPRTLDEMVSVDVLLGRQPDVGAIDAVVCIVDATNLERNLYLFSQVRDLGLPTLLVVNMWDVARQKGIHIDLEKLAAAVQVPVIATSAHRRTGLDELRKQLRILADSEVTRPERVFPAEFYTEAEGLGERVERATGERPPFYLLERAILDVGGQIEQGWTTTHPALATDIVETRERLKAAGCRIPTIEAQSRYAWARQALQGVVERPQEVRDTWSDRLDRLLTHRVAGLVVFAALMFVVFQAIYAWAGPFMDAIETGQGWLAGVIESGLAPGSLRSLIVDGVIAGVGGVLVFLPQIVILFLFIAILEDCGYMARAAFLMDRLMTRIGLSGKSFVPLMSSFACAIPGIMAARVIENRRDRMVTILVAPLMSCSARLPVYLLLIAAFIPATTYAVGVSLQGLVLFAMYSLGAVVAIPVAWLLKKTWFKGETPPFVMELPEYKWPSLRNVLHRVVDRAWAFISRAGTLIFLTTILIWAAGYFPGDHTEQHRIATQLDDPGNLSEAEIADLEARQNVVSAQLIRGSLLGRAGQWVEPAVRPLGWDWRIGVGVIASFPAREVIIATLGTIYSLGGDVDEEDAGLKGALREARWPDGSRVFNVPVALSIMVFFALCAQCAATLMVIRRETNSWWWPTFTFAYMTGLAYVAAFATYQIGMRLLA